MLSDPPSGQYGGQPGVDRRQEGFTEAERLAWLARVGHVGSDTFSGGSMLVDEGSPNLLRLRIANQLNQLLDEPPGAPQYQKGPAPTDLAMLSGCTASGRPGKALPPWLDGTLDMGGPEKPPALRHTIAAQLSSFLSDEDESQNDACGRLAEQIAAVTMSPCNVRPQSPSQHYWRPGSGAFPMGVIANSPAIYHRPGC